MNTVLYIYDPLCGWCYAASPTIDRLIQAGLTVNLQPSGLFSVPGRVLTAEFAAYAWENDQRISTLTGQRFSETYHRNVLGAVGTPFDSSVATLALTAVAMSEGAREAEALKALQEARYIAGRDITDASSVGAILRNAGCLEAAASLEARSPALTSLNASRVAASQATMRKIGASGVPTLVMVDGEKRRLLDSKLLYGGGDDLLTLAGHPSRLALEGDQR